MAGEAVDAVQELKLAAVLDARDEQRRWEEEEEEEEEEMGELEESEEEEKVGLTSADTSPEAGSAGAGAGAGKRWVCGPRVEAVMRSKVARLVKPDMLLALQELQRQQQWRLAARVRKRVREVTVFEHVRTEHWYKPDADLCARMINCLGLAGRITDAQALFRATQDEDGMPPCSPTYTALLAAHCRSGDHRSGREVLRRMREAQAGPYDAAYMILIKTCEAQGDAGAAAELKQERDVVLAEWGQLGLPKPPRRSKKM
ncbi:unnamed protein product [Closterium sp. NIES-64]|nr:unnamed protein product [Closterium sp. NIES-64]